MSQSRSSWVVDQSGWHLQGEFPIQGEPRLEPLHSGYCSVTEDGNVGDCANGDKGSWTMPTPPSLVSLGRRSWQWCLERCVSCKRCTFVSSSTALRDCSWFASDTCDLAGLKHAFGTGHGTVRVRDERGAVRPTVLNFLARSPPLRLCEAPDANATGRAHVGSPSVRLVRPRRGRKRARLCEGEAQNDGAWLQARRPPERQPCCQQEHGMYRWTRDDCGEDLRHFVHPRGAGLDHMWAHAAMRGHARYYSPMNGFGCSCCGFRDAYEWRPRKCHLVPWNARRFCTLLGSRRMFFFGDSTMLQTAAAMMNAVLSGHRNSSGSVGGSGCQTQLHFQMHDTLVGRFYGANNRGAHWLESVRELGVRPRDVLVLSTGAHVYGTENFTSVLREIVQGYQQLPAPKPRLVWKTQHPAGCGEAPLAALPSATPGYWPQQDQAGAGGFGGSYNWPSFEARDAQAKRAWEGVGRARVLDIEPLYYRVDAHVSSPGNLGLSTFHKRDCLHSCIPGPLSTLVPQLLLHLLVDMFVGKKKKKKGRRR